MNYKAVVLSPSDNVATVLDEIPLGSALAVGRGEEIVSLTAVEAIPFGHKLALRRLEAGEAVIKYGQVIGVAITDIREGCLVHVHNVESLRGRGDKQ